jgi:hypothetical protein
LWKNFDIKKTHLKIEFLMKLVHWLNDENNNEKVVVKINEKCEVKSQLLIILAMNKNL